MQSVNLIDRFHVKIQIECARSVQMDVNLEWMEWRANGQTCSESFCVL